MYLKKNTPYFDKHVQSVNFLHLLVLGSTVVTCDPRPGAVPVRTFGGNTSGLGYLGGHTLHPERKKNSSVSLPQTTADNYMYMYFIKGWGNCSDVAVDIPKNIYIFCV